MQTRRMLEAGHRREDTDGQDARGGMQTAGCEGAGCRRAK